MIAATISSVGRFLSLYWLTGPIFAKELRMASRRRRHYLLRFAYLVLLSVFAVGMWLANLESDAQSMTVYKMSDVVQAVVGTICWFQFVALQLVAVSLLSSAISEEVVRGTLGVLLTTPITAIQIVAGKLLSKLLHLAGLLAVGLPLLAVVRVFGGVPWGYVLAASCISLTAAVFAGCVAMFYSTIFRRTYASILLTLATGFVLYMVLPTIVGLFVAVAAIATGQQELLGLALCVNPFMMLMACTMELYGGGGGGLAPSSYWPLHCVVMLGLCVAVLVPCAFLVRRAAKRQIGGGAATASAAPIAIAPRIRPAPATAILPATAAAPVRLADAPPPLPPPGLPPHIPRPGARAAGKIRRITGSPIVWRKLRTPMFTGTVLRIVALCLVLGLALITYILIGALEELSNSGVHAAYVVVYLLMGMTTTAVFAATSISSEKESRTLPILLTTPLGNWHIVGALMLGVLRRTLPAWAFLVAHVGLFVLVGILHPILIVHVTFLMLWTIALLTCTGLYFSAKCRRTTVAVVLNLGFALGIWAIVPIVIGMLDVSGTAVFEPVIWLNPVGQAAVVVTGAGQPMHGNALAYSWRAAPQEIRKPIGATILLLVSCVSYFLVSFLFLWRAKSALRRNLF